MFKYIQKILNGFWRNVASDLKQSVTKPFLKDSDKDPTEQQNYRPISLLNSMMKAYEQIIKCRLMGLLEKNFFSTMQTAYRKCRSTSDLILLLQEIFYFYWYAKRGPRGDG